MIYHVSYLSIHIHLQKSASFSKWVLSKNLLWITVNGIFKENTIVLEKTVCVLTKTLISSLLQWG